MDTLHEYHTTPLHLETTKGPQAYILSLTEASLRLHEP